MPPELATGLYLAQLLEKESPWDMAIRAANTAARMALEPRQANYCHAMKNLLDLAPQYMPSNEQLMVALNVVTEYFVDVSPAATSLLLQMN